MSKAWSELYYSAHAVGYKEVYKELYGIDFPEKEVAPVQLEKKEAPKPKVDNKKVKIPEKPKPVKKEEPKVEEAPMEEAPVIQESEEECTVPEVEVVQEEEISETENLSEDDELMDTFLEWQSAGEKFSSAIKRNDKAAALSNIHTLISKAERIRNILLKKGADEYEE